MAAEQTPIPVKRTVRLDAGIRTRQVYLTVFIIALAIWMALPFLTPIAWAAVLAMAEWPLYRRAVARAHGWSGLIAVGFTLGTALLVIMPLSLAAVTLAQESQAAIDWIQHAQRFGVPAPHLLGALPLVGTRASGWWAEHIASPQGANALLGSISAGSVLDWTRSIGGEVARESAVFMITLIILATLLARGAAIADQTRTIAGRMFGAFGQDFVFRLSGAVRATVNGTLLVSFVEGAVIGVGYAVTGVPQPLLFATFTIILALIPFGAWAAFGLASLILIGTGSVLAGVLLFVFAAVVMTIGDNLVQPAVIGSAVELPFLLALLGAFGGLADMGLVGLFVGPVIMAALLLVWQEWMRPAEGKPAPDALPEAATTTQVVAAPR
jgi:predicted PurR-regulated permease PerM